MNPNYFDWSEESLIDEFQITENDLKPYWVLFAIYVQPPYEGDAHVLLKGKNDGLLYEVNGSHCSCMGLEGQWNPELTSVEALKHRFEKGEIVSHIDNEEDNLRFKKEYGELLDSLTEEVH